MRYTRDWEARYPSKYIGLHVGANAHANDWWTDVHVLAIVRKTEDEGQSTGKAGGQGGGQALVAEQEASCCEGSVWETARQRGGNEVSWRHTQPPGVPPEWAGLHRACHPGEQPASSLPPAAARPPAALPVQHSLTCPGGAGW